MNNRQEREKEQYNKGFDKERKNYDDKFGHARYGVGYYSGYLQEKAREIMKKAKGKKVLEIGCTDWRYYLDFINNPPSDVTCINISSRELQKGINLYTTIQDQFSKNINFQFKTMDAHNLEFDDEHFDVVIGKAILHHLDFEKAVREIQRVLKKDGFCLFIEPMGCNPVGKIIRKKTPEARTIDEKPLEQNEIDILNKYFEVEYQFFQLFTVPAGFISGKISKNPYNLLMKTAFHFDKFLEKFMPMRFKMLYRIVLINGKKQVIAKQNKQKESKVIFY